VRIRTRHKLFRAIIGVAVLVFLASLFDMFLNDAAWMTYVLATYLVLAVLALVLYLGHKPVLPDEEPVPEGAVEPMPVPDPLAAEAAAQEEAVVEIEEVPKRRPIGGVHVEGPHYFRCPFCSHAFALEATHLRRTHDFRMNCPYCANSIRVPRKPKVAPGNVRPLHHAAPGERVLFACTNCGEVLRFTAPQSRLERALSVTTCPQCRSPTLALATA
jgi:transcription elongation factor Elf1